ncbi:MAG: SRPBCC domain-containing protein [Planctomycetes bacterium]|nr:SRPBCC domain-containing protein [Planctomycetota bacterium]
MTRSPIPHEPKLDLVLERIAAAPPRLVWAAWTRPEHLVHWFTPAPWIVTACEIDLRPGGMFRTILRSPADYAPVMFLIASRSRTPLSR